MRTRTISGLLCALTMTLLIGCAPKKPVQAPPPPSPAPVRKPKVQLPKPYDTRILRATSHVRAEPTTASPIVATCPAGTKVGLLKLKGGWYKVLADSTVGWIWGPLVNRDANDRFMAALTYAIPRFEDDSLFVSKYQTPKGLTIILSMAWRNMTKQQKEQTVEQAGSVWREACEKMGIKPPPTIRFMSNNNVEMARWHGFWGAKVYH